MTARRSRPLLVATATYTFLAAAIVPATAQTQVQQDRIDQVSRFVITAPLCERLGMTLDPALPDTVEAAFRTETSGWAVDRVVIDQLKAASLNRQSTVFQMDLDAVIGAAKSEAQLRQIRTKLVSYGRSCVSAARDTIFSKVIHAPPTFDVESAVTAFADSLLEDGGLASWQTPAIRARGQIMMAAGTCRRKVGKARSDALVAEFGKSDDPRARNYYLKSFDLGLEDTDASFSLAQCNRLITRSRADVVKAGSR
jgi:hypothetical protein